MGGANPLHRAKFLLNEIEAAIEWYCKYGGADDDSLKLARAKAARAQNGKSAGGMAVTLYLYADLAEQNRMKLDGVAGFDATLIDEAVALVQPLHGHRGRGRPTSSEQRSAIWLRNELALMLLERMNTVREAARHVYRNQPEIILEVTSQYERTRRSNNRQAKKGGPKK